MTVHEHSRRNFAVTGHQQGSVLRMGARTRAMMLGLAQCQLQLAFEYARPEDPADIVAYTREVRELFARQNREMNWALQEFWRRQIQKYQAVT